MLKKRSSDASFGFSDAAAQKSRSSVSPSFSMFRLRALIVSLGHKILPNSESGRSPMSPLELQLVIHNLPSSLHGSSRSPKCWMCSKVGLGAVVDEMINPCGKIVFGSPKKLKTPAAFVLESPKSTMPNSDNPSGGEMLPESQDLGKVRSCAAEKMNIEKPSSINTITDVFHSQTPKLTSTVRSWQLKCPVDFLSICFSCRKKLDGEDIYIYRGEKAFCSSGCREEHIVIEEEEAEAAAQVLKCRLNQINSLERRVLLSWRPYT